MKCDQLVTQTPSKRPGEEAFSLLETAISSAPGVTALFFHAAFPWGETGECLRTEPELSVLSQVEYVEQTTSGTS